MQAVPFDNCDFVGDGELLENDRDFRRTSR